MAFYDLTEYYVKEPSVKDGSVQWVLLNQITVENGFHPETMDFFQKNIHIRTLYHIPTQEEVPPPILVYHSFQTATRTDDPVFGFPFVFTEKPIYPVETSSNNVKQPVENPKNDVLKSSTEEKQPVENPEKDDQKSATGVEPANDNKKPNQNILSYIYFISTVFRKNIGHFERGVSKHFPRIIEKIQRRFFKKSLHSFFEKQCGSLDRQKPCCCLSL